MKSKIDSVDILGVRVDKVTLDQAVGTVEGWLDEGHGKHYIVTPNVEFIMAAQKDGEFKKVLNQADLGLPDGFGLKLASDIKDIVAGVDLMEELVQLAAEKGFSVGFLGGKDGVAKKTAEVLGKKYPGLRVVLAEDGPEVDQTGSARGPASSQPHSTSSLVTTSLRAVNGAPRSLSPLAIPSLDLLFVAFGAVKQEKWIAKNLIKLPVKVAMGVGGSFDEISGRVPKVPRWVHALGLKWLVRLIIEPWRIKRQLALIKFVFLVYFK